MALVALVVVAGAGCGGGPSASVGVAPTGGTVEVRAKACGGGAIERVDLVDPRGPEAPVWTAVLEAGPARQAVVVRTSVPGYRVTDRRDGPLPDRTLRVLARGTDGETWGGPRFRPSQLEEGRLRVAGQDVPVAEWEAEPARCSRVGLAGALVAGLATAAAAGGLWLVVRLGARAVRRARPSS